MQIRAEEISSIIKKEISDYEHKTEVAETGTVLAVGDGIASVYGLRSALNGEMVEFQGGVRGLVLNLEEDNVGVAIMGHDIGIREGHTVKRTGEIAQVKVGEATLGRVVNALGQPIDGMGEIKSDIYSRIETKAPGITARKSVHEPLQTGLKAI
ncbi:F0F1 ATP synthase subunit alpha, partial [Myxococcota bacterium]|nr:F0F1 ATP synthase subunit alpha [Myxococcota bacterium]